MEKKKKNRKEGDQTSPDPSRSGGEKVHKKPWQEAYKPEEIDMNRRMLAS